MLGLANWLLAFSARAPFFSDHIEMEPSKSVWSTSLQFGLILGGFQPLILTRLRKIFGITVLIEDGEGSYHPSPVTEIWSHLPSFRFVYSQPKLRHTQIPAVPKMQTEVIQCPTCLLQNLALGICCLFMRKGK